MAKPVPPTPSVPLAANLVGESSAARSGDDGRPQHRAGGMYSRFVAFMKIVLPLLAVVLIVVVVTWPQLKLDNRFSLGFSTALISDAKPGMDQARYTGTDDNRQPFSVTADTARIINEEMGEISLAFPKADLTLEDGTWLVLTANTGIYKRTAGTLTLSGDVNLFHDTGYEISTGALIANLKTGGIEGHTALNGHGPFGEINAQGLTLIDKGRVIKFAGPAQLIMYAPKGED